MVGFFLRDSFWIELKGEGERNTVDSLWCYFIIYGIYIYNKINTYIKYTYKVS